MAVLILTTGVCGSGRLICSGFYRHAAQVEALGQLALMTLVEHWPRVRGFDTRGVRIHKDLPIPSGV